MQAKEDFRPLAMASIEASLQSYSPYSQFKVGAAVLTIHNKIYKGTNVENASFGGTICAERTALCKMVSEEWQVMQEKGPKSFIQAIAVASNLRGQAVFPCGLCLQVMQEFMSGDEPVILVNRETQEIEKIFSLRELMPHGFSLHS